MKQVKIFHCADIHLDTPFSLSSPSKAESRRIELRGVFSSAIMFAKSQNADLFFISGDFFDSQYVLRDTLETLITNFKQFPTCHFFISPGNHDPYNDASPYKRIEFPENVHIFGACKERVSLQELGVDVYGVGFTETNYISSPVVGYPPLDNEKINILVCHGDLTSPLSTSGPISKKDIASSGFDYIALGHIHKPTDILCENGVYYAYPGCIEGRGFDETGYKGAFFGTVTKGRVNLERVRLSKRRYEILTHDLTGAITKNQALQSILAAISQYHDDTALRLILTGETKEAFIITPEDIGEGAKLPYFIEIVDKTVPSIDFTLLEKESTLKGVFYKSIREKLDAVSSENDEYTALLGALRYGLAALSNRDIGNLL